MKGLHGFEYAEIVYRVASYLISGNGQVDVLGNIRDDYVSDLCLEALTASRIFREKYGGCRAQEARYVYKSLWNYARMMNRSRARCRFSHPQPLDSQLDPIRLEQVIEARSSIRALRENLDATNLEILTRIAAAGGSTTDAWKEDPTCNRSWFSTRVQRARRAAKKILQM